MESISEECMSFENFEYGNSEDINEISDAYVKKAARKSMPGRLLKTFTLDKKKAEKSVPRYVQSVGRAFLGKDA